MSSNNTVKSVKSNTRRRRSRSLNRGRTFRKNSRRARSVEPYKNIKAEKIGEGAFGTVSRPPARCDHFFSRNSKNINQRNLNSIVFQETYYKNPNYISKLTETYYARKELDIGALIKDNVEHWKDYYCFIEFMCGAPKEKYIQVGINDYQDAYGIAPYCGVTLNNILSGKYPISAIKCCCLMEALKQLAIGLSKLHKIQIYHQDIHDRNILFNPEDGKLRWIDFGLAADHLDVKKKAINSGKSWRINNILLSARMTDTSDLIFTIIKPTLEFIYDTIDNSKKTALTDKCKDDAAYYLDIIPKSMNSYILPNRNNSFNEYMESKIKIEKEYIKFMNEFVGDLDEDKKCKWMFKNNNNNNNNK